MFLDNQLFAYGTLMFSEVWLYLIGRECPRMEAKLLNHSAFIVNGYTFPGLRETKYNHYVKGILYSGITKRALFLPYEKKASTPLPPSNQPKTKTTPPPPGPESYKVVSLSQWKGKQEVMIYNSIKKETKSYKLGDSLAGGTIVMIDYRQMPFPNKPDLLSQSRVIVLIKAKYWAIERGNTMADMYQLTLEQLPENIKNSQL